MNVQVSILEIERHLQPFALNRGKQGGVDGEIDRVAEFVRFARRSGFNAGREINGVVASGGTLAETAEQVPKRFITEKVEPFFSNFETNVAWQRLRKHLTLSR